MNTTLIDVMMTNWSIVTESLPKSIRATIRNTNFGFHQLFNLYLMGAILVAGVITNSIIIVIMRDGHFRNLHVHLLHRLGNIRHGGSLFYCRLAIHEADHRIPLFHKNQFVFNLWLSF